MVAHWALLYLDNRRQAQAGYRPYGDEVLRQVSST